MIYKSHVIDCARDEGETVKDYQARVWFVSKNVHMLDTNSKTIKNLDMDTLIGYSYVHIKISSYGHSFHHSIMDCYEKLEKNLYLY